MSVALITGSAGLIGSEASRWFAEQGMLVVGIDNDMRKCFFGDDASTHWNRCKLERELPGRYRHYEVDIRDQAGVEQLFRKYAADIELVIHTAAQPSHDWAARDPLTDFSVNAQGTLHLLEATRRHASEAPFIFTSSNKVYGDRPNCLPLVELATRWEIDPSHEYQEGIPEEMPIDQCLHSLFGASKVAADVLVQEYGRYFSMPTACFRGGCLTGPSHSGAPLHGFLAYLMKCAVTGTRYTVHGYLGKQVRDNIHAVDLVRAFDCFHRRPRCGAVYNIGGGRQSNCSMLEAIALCEQIAGRELQQLYSSESRIGDHQWWISDLSRFRRDYPEWTLEYEVPSILREIHDANVERWLTLVEST